MLRTTLMIACGLSLATLGCKDDVEVAASATPSPNPDPVGVEAMSIPRVRLEPALPRVRFRRPVYVTHAGDGTDRLFVVEQYGRILVTKNDPAREQAEVFLDIRPKVHKRHNEEGLLALAFDPAFADNGFFYVYYSADGPRRGVLSRFKVSPANENAADPASEHVIFEIEQPWGNHNGCTALFGPDGHLYFSLGDGGWANDPLGSGQDLSTLLGTILRIDVRRSTRENPYAIPADNPFVGRDGARGEIWAFGLRNVWRMSFDRATGDLWAGDVGQNKWEEIDLIVKGGNYGWDLREGAHEFKKNKTPTLGPMIDPVAEYPRSSGLSVTGGYVYRGTKQPSLAGVYLYADYASGRMWGLRYENGSLTEQREVLTPTPPRYISSFGEDEAGEVYVTAFDKLDGKGSTGRVYRVTAY